MNFAITRRWIAGTCVSRINCLAKFTRKPGLIYMVIWEERAQRATLSTVTIISDLFSRLPLSILIHLECTRTREEFARKKASGSATSSELQVHLSDSSAFKIPHLISDWPMKQRRGRGKWTISLCNVIHGWSALSKCLLRQPSKSAVKRILQKKGCIQGRPFSLSLACPAAAGYQAYYIPALCAFFI